MLLPATLEHVSHQCLASRRAVCALCAARTPVWQTATLPVRSTVRCPVMLGYVGRSPLFFKGFSSSVAQIEGTSVCREQREKG
jgi:hypothetical protein